MTPFDAARFTPPAPLARVKLRHLDTGVTIDEVPMLMDSGADVSLIPHASVNQLGTTISAEQGYELMAFDGTRSIAQVVHLELVFLRRAFKGRFLLINQEWGIIGRDILNHLVILLDGPQLTWSEYKNA